MHALFSPLHIKIIEEIVEGIVEKIPSLINVQEVMNKYPVMYEESMNTVLVQEVIRYVFSFKKMMFYFLYILETSISFQKVLFHIDKKKCFLKTKSAC